MMRQPVTSSSPATVCERQSDVLRESAVRALSEVIGKGPRTITELGDAAGVSRHTIRRAVDYLIQRGYLRDCDPRTTDVGRPARTIDLGRGNTHIVGILVTAASTSIRLTSVTGLQRGGIDLDSAALTALEDPTEWVDAVGQPIFVLCREANVPRASIVSAVVSVSGIVTSQGRVRISIATPAFTGCELAALLAECTGIKDVLIENDTALCALGEMRTGAAQDVEDFLYVLVHGSMHPSLVIGGEIHRGADNAVAESDILCRLGIVPDTVTIGGLDVPFDQLGLRIDDGELGPDWLDAFIQIHCRILATLSYITDPEAIVISGGEITTSRDCLDQIEQYIASTRVTERSPRILAGRGGKDVGLVGAQHFAIHRALARELGTTIDLPVPTIGAG